MAEGDAVSKAAMPTLGVDEGDAVVVGVSVATATATAGLGVDSCDMANGRYLSV